MFQLHQTRLVPSWRLVRAARELESQHRGHGGGMLRHHGRGVERERRSGGADQDARGGAVFSESVVGFLLIDLWDVVVANCGLGRWSKQIIEHERKLKEKR